jgi:hypothetical protein
MSVIQTVREKIQKIEGAASLYILSHWHLLAVIAGTILVWEILEELCEHYWR